MKYFNHRSLAALLLFLFCATLSFAQPGGGPGGHGGGFPGGRPPMGGPGGRPGGRPPMGDMNMRPDDKSAQQVKQKKNVKDGATFKVVGSLRDSVSGEFLAYVNVAILDTADSSFVKGGATNLDGYFEITGVPAGGYLLRVSSVGYKNLWHRFSVENNTALGTLRMKPGTAMLNEVVITAEKPLYAMEGEKMIYNVSDDPSIQTGTTNDALQNAPGVEVDIEGNITLRGVSSVEIWVNDKPSKLTEENLKTYLETLPANALARIETITNPSAKYATEAEAVINIVTEAHIKSNQFVSFGVNGSNQPFVSPWVSYMWAKEKLSFNLYASGRYSYRDNASSGWSVSRKDREGVPGEYDTLTYETDTTNSWNKSLGGNIFVNMNYEVDSMTDISAWGGIHYNHSNNFSDNSHMRDQHWQSAGDLFEYRTIDTSRSNSIFGNIGADYTHKFDKEGHNLRIGIDGHFNTGNTEKFYNRDYSTYNRLYSGFDQNKYYLTNSNGGSFGIDARYNRPYSKDGEMSYGFGFNHDNSHNTYDRAFFDDNTNDYTHIDTLRSYEFSGSDDEVNADVNWTHRWGGFTLELGLGGMYDRMSFDYKNEYYPDDTTYNFFTVNPSIHMTYRTEDMHNFKLNYSLRMRNPDESNLTKFRFYGEDSYSTGNRALKPSYTHSAEAGWTKFFERFGNVGIEGYARYSANEVDNLTDVTEDADEWIGRIINYSVPYNMGSSYRYGASLNMTYRPSGFLNVRLYSNIYDYGYNMTYMRGDELKEVSDSKLSWSLRLNAWTKVLNKYQIHASANYSSPTIGLMSQRKARYNLNLGVRADFFKRKLSAFVNVQDIFNWGARYGFGTEITNPYYLSDSTNKMLNSRYISAGITLRFGKMELERNAKDGSSAEGDSLE